MNWQPIETAPKDAKDGVLGWVPHYYQGRGGVAVICWVNGRWLNNRMTKAEPTHWMSLPGAPQS